jgi:hypothetical protein
MRSVDPYLNPDSDLDPDPLTSLKKDPQNRKNLEMKSFEVLDVLRAEGIFCSLDSFQEA